MIDDSWVYRTTARIRTVANIVQSMADELCALCHRFPSTMTDLFLAAEYLHIRAVLPTLNPEDRLFFDAITTLLPPTIVNAAPNPQEGGGDG